ncbi:MAG: tetratricopeptide repeat protein, partial [Actinocrinis sp.]
MSAADLLTAAQDALYEAAFRTDDFTAAETLIAEARAQSIADGDRLSESMIGYLTGMWMHYQALTYLFRGEKVPADDIAAEEAVFQESLDIGREVEQATGDPVGTACAQFGLGLVHQVLRGDWQ